MSNNIYDFVCVTIEIERKKIPTLSDMKKLNEKKINKCVVYNCNKQRVNIKRNKYTTKSLICR